MEINNSFYRWPPVATFEKWREQGPPGFRYAVKANRFLTQAKKLKDGADALHRLLPGIAALGPTLGPLLFQLPPRFRLNLERLETFLALLPADLLTAFEFRDASWYVPEVLALLDRHGAGFCAHDLPGFATPRRACGRIGYVRFHGGVGKYWGRYPDGVLAGWAEWIVAEASTGRDVWAYFNNDVGGDAIHDALTLRAMVRQATG